MSVQDWARIRFLESGENLKPLVRERIGREPSTAIAREIAACLQQGRLFYEAAAATPLEIRPLQMFYGLVAFAKAVVIAHHLRSQSTLPHAQGLTDISAHNSRISELRVKIGNSGTFEEFNNVVSDFTRLNYLDGAAQLHTVSLPSAKSASLCGFDLSLKEILRRIPGLESLYRMTFGEDAGTALIDFSREHRKAHAAEKCGIHLYVPVLFSDCESLRRIVIDWRVRFPILQRWRLVQAKRWAGESMLYFRNLDNSHLPDEFAYPSLVEQGEMFVAPTTHESMSFPLPQNLHPVAGFCGKNYIMSPINDQYFSEFALHYVALFVLSSLVRYRPQTWMHAISRSALPDTPADDQTLSLLETFLAIDSRVIPKMVVRVLNPNEDRYLDREDSDFG